MSLDPFHHASTRAAVKAPLIELLHAIRLASRDAYDSISVQVSYDPDAEDFAFDLVAFKDGETLAGEGI